MGTQNSATLDANEMRKRGPKLRDLSLTATERMAITALLRDEQTLIQQMQQLEAAKAEIAVDIEKRLRLPAGALGENATHRVNLDENKVEPFDG